MNHLSSAFERLLGCERQLASAFGDMAQCHCDEYEIARGCTLSARWATEHVHSLGALAGAFGFFPGVEASVVRESLFQVCQPPGVALLRDLEDLLTLTHQTRTAWMSLEQAAKILKNGALNQCVSRCCAELNREIAWLETQLKNAAPQALLVS